jgi:uncharacterized membrane-anchored protein
VTRRSLIFVGLAVALGVPAGLVMHKEGVVRHGDLLLLRLAPVDPRSLIEGDFMQLDYEVSNAVRLGAHEEVPADGKLVLKVDAGRRGTFARFDDGSPLGPDELRLRYRRRKGFVRLGAEAFYFQEGRGDRYTMAKYGELRVTGSGDAVLVGLRDEELKPLGR